MFFALTVASLLVSCGCGCGDDSADSGPPGDGATGESIRDAERDTSQDTVTDPQDDVAEDAVVDVADDGADSGDGGFDIETSPGWVPMEGYPESCQVERATRPETLIDSRFEPCGPGCVHLVRDNRWVRGVNPSGFHDGTRGYFSTNQTDIRQPERLRRRIIVFAGTDGEVFGAWRGSSGFEDLACLPGTVVVGDGYAVLRVSVGDNRLQEDHLYYNTVEDIGSQELPTAVLGSDVVGRGGVIQRGQVSRHVFAAELQPRGDLLMLRPNGDFERQDVGGNPQRISVVGENAFFDVWFGDEGRVVTRQARFGEGNWLFRGHPEAHVVSFVANENQMSWYEAYSPGTPGMSDRIELWTSPTALTSSGLEPRFVRQMLPQPLPGYQSGFGGTDHFWLQYEPATRLSDGALLRLPAGSGIEGEVDAAGNLGYLWAAGGEVATAVVLAGGAGIGEDQGSMRRDLLSGLSER